MPDQTLPPRLATARKKRRPHRRDEILAAATKLFYERGFHATGMDDIGAAAGITGPAIYRHFNNKEDLLETLVLERSVAALDQARSLVEGAPPIDGLRQLVRLYVGTILENPALAHVSLLERRTLRGETRAKIERAERLHVEEWVHALTRVRPELPDADARVMVHAVVGLGVMAAVYRSGLDRATLLNLIAEMIMTALLSDGAAPDR